MALEASVGMSTAKSASMTQMSSSAQKTYNEALAMASSKSTTNNRVRAAAASTSEEHYASLSADQEVAAIFGASADDNDVDRPKLIRQNTFTKDSESSIQAFASTASASKNQAKSFRTRVKSDLLVDHWLRRMQNSKPLITKILELQFVNQVTIYK